MKIIDKINKASKNKQTIYSFEYFPPKTAAGIYNLHERLDRMALLAPAFIDVTWGAGGTTCDLTLEISANAQKYSGLDVMMHLTCTNMPQEKIEYALNTAKENGIRNILALRGDPPQGADKWIKCAGGFNYASDLVRYIRNRYGDYFGICVGGYPEGHPEAVDKKNDLQNLRGKVDAGADFIITQLFYDVDEYLTFLESCRSIGITCPIIPGLMPIQNYNGFLRFTNLSQTKVPKQVLDTLEPIKDDDAAVKAYGIELCSEMCQKLLNNGAPGLHFYTLNLERSVTRVLQNLGLINSAESRRVLPWRSSALPGRQQEDVRPIFWNNRPRSYLIRTMDWDDFPNGRWGDSGSPAFGNLNEYYLIRRGMGYQAKQHNFRSMWGENPQTHQDIYAVFVNFCEGKIKRLPWSELPVQQETLLIRDDLVALNRNGFLTINSQPQVNAAPSTDPHVGWGGPGGYIYQKAYVEFFVSKDTLSQLLDIIENFPSLTYHAVDVAGNSFTNNNSEKHVNAVTWGVFPGKEIIQPTIVDSSSFMIWKSEAFELWMTDWASLYAKESSSYKLIQDIHDNYFLVNLVENDYVHGDIFRIFKHMQTSRELRQLA